jgi:hypothetical protein
VPEFDEIFSREYQPGQQTQAVAPKAMVEMTSEAENQLQSELKMYGVGKPKRIVIKAKLIDD